MNSYLSLSILNNTEMKITISLPLLIHIKSKVTLIDIIYSDERL